MLGETINPRKGRASENRGGLTGLSGRWIDRHLKYKFIGQRAARTDAVRQNADIPYDLRCVCIEGWLSLAAANADDVFPSDALGQGADDFSAGELVAGICH